jgi:LysM repeat protein
MPNVAKSLFGLRMFFVIVLLPTGCGSTINVKTDSDVVLNKNLLAEEAPSKKTIDYYTVKEGDTFLRIAMEHGISWRDLAIWNKLSNPNLITVGQELRVSPPTSHEIAENTDADDQQKNSSRKIESFSGVVNNNSSRIDEERRHRKQQLASQYINLQVNNTQPDVSGVFNITIKTNTDTASLKINGEEQGGKQDGSYNLKKVARAGQESDFTIIAIDINGNSATKTITVSRPLADSKPIVAALNPAQVKRQPERDAVAVIIGIADYKNLPRADYANDDARVFYDYAIRALGVKPENIKLLVDADADEVGIYRVFKTWLPSRVRASTDVYVYYSGHGLPTADGRGLYLLPQRADRDFMDKTAITQAEINAAIQAAKPKSVTIFLDACYSGQARTGETLLASARPVALKTETAAFPEGFTVITASRGDQISSSSPELKHGIFSYYLMRGMEGDADANRDGRITAGEMQAYLAENVARQAGMMNRRQEPQLIGDANRILVGR